MDLVPEDSPMVLRNTRSQPLCAVALSAQPAHRTGAAVPHRSAARLK